MNHLPFNKESVTVGLFKRYKINPLLKKANKLVKQEKYQEALKCYNNILEIDSNSAGAWYAKANVLFKLERFDEALECCNTIYRVGIKELYFLLLLFNP